jgi:hypothetical protein
MYLKEQERQQQQIHEKDRQPAAVSVVASEEQNINVRTKATLKSADSPQPNALNTKSEENAKTSSKPLPLEELRQQRIRVLNTAASSKRDQNTKPTTPPPLPLEELRQQRIRVLNTASSKRDQNTNANSTKPASSKRDQNTNVSSKPTTPSPLQIDELRQQRIRVLNTASSKSNANVNVAESAVSKNEPVNDEVKTSNAAKAFLMRQKEKNGQEPQEKPPPLYNKGKVVHARDILPAEKTQHDALTVTSKTSVPRARVAKGGRLPLSAKKQKVSSTKKGK